jgi:hypothetical protein
LRAGFLATPLTNRLSTDANSGLLMGTASSIDVIEARAVDVEYAGQHSFNTLESMDIDGVDFGAAFQTSSQDPSTSVRPQVCSTTPTGPKDAGFGVANNNQAPGTVQAQIRLSF